MKNISIKYILSVVVLAGGLNACTNLDEKDKSNYIEGPFPSPSNEQTYQSVAYQSLSAFKGYIGAYWNICEASTDEVVVPTRGGDWGDGNKWKDLHLHEWTENHGEINGAWEWGYGGISTCNQILYTLEQAPQFKAKGRLMAEVSTMRAFYYFCMMDAFGNIPIAAKIPTEDPTPETKPVAEVFAFIETELKAAIDSLSEDVSVATYGLPTKWAAWSMLAKLYLNAGVYTNTSRWDDAIAACGKVVASGKYDITNNFTIIFSPDNGPGNKEVIFAVPFDAQKATGMDFQMRTLHYASRATFLIPSNPYNGFCTLEDFYKSFADPNDQRNKMWLAGPQKDAAGAPLMSDGKQVVLTPEIKFNVANPNNPFDVGGSFEGKGMGARSIKYYPDKNSNGGSGNNDYAFLRYADVLLMEAEAKARKANVPAMALPAVNAIRTQRGAGPLAILTWDDLLAERGREMAWEGWRRNDLVRFGKWEGKWGIKTDADVQKRIFPIPRKQLDLNPKLVQNKGY